MLTPGEIASAVATDAVNLYETDDGRPYIQFVDLIVDGYATADAHTMRWMRRIVSGLVERGVGVALAQCPVPSPVSDDRIEEIEAANENPERWGHAAATAAIRDLVRHIRHMHRVMNGPEAEAIAAEVRRERERCVALARQADRDYCGTDDIYGLRKLYDGIGDRHFERSAEFIIGVLEGRFTRR